MGYWWAIIVFSHFISKGGPISEIVHTDTWKVYWIVIFNRVWQFLWWLIICRISRIQNVLWIKIVWLLKQVRLKVVFDAKNMSPLQHSLSWWKAMKTSIGSWKKCRSVLYKGSICWPPLVEFISETVKDWGICWHIYTTISSKLNQFEEKKTASISD